MPNAEIDSYVAQVETYFNLPAQQNHVSDTDVVSYVYSLGLTPCLSKAIILAVAAKYPKIFGTTPGKGKGRK